MLWKPRMRAMQRLCLMPKKISSSPKQRSADVKFLRNLRVTCQNLDREWELRCKTRGQEMVAVSEALSIITSDDNRELLSKSTSFLQESSEMQLRRNKAASSLRKAAEFPDFDADDFSVRGMIVEARPSTDH